MPVEPKRKKEGGKGGRIIVEAGEMTKYRVDEVARVAGTTSELIGERLFDYFLTLKLEEQKRFTSNASGITVI